MSTECYEVEIRFKVDDAAEAFALLPFFEESLGKQTAWDTDIIGREIYESGRLLRVGKVPPQGAMRHYLDYKDEDIGTFANIRREWGEEISDGAADSAILSKLGLAGSYSSADEIRTRLTEAGHTPFMSFTGEDRQGFYAPLQLQTKLMWCPKILHTQFLIELEMAADSLDEALAAEAMLQQIAQKYGIIDRLIRDEPPTMLFQCSF